MMDSPQHFDQMMATLHDQLQNHPESKAEILCQWAKRTGCPYLKSKIKAQLKPDATK